MTGRTARPERASATREAILATAERLFAEHGVHAVSNRQISEAAGQGNSAAVGYHFGTKADLVRAIARRHADEMEQLRAGLVAGVTGSADVRDWVGCLVRPFTRHLEAQGSPTWYARFRAQVMADPALYRITVEE
ncbi:TetR/AcrR family transcriptional regulator, partial [Nonomuraea sp. NPDC004297]